MYSFGAMLSFTVAHAAVTQLRRRGRNDELGYRSRPNLRFRGVDWPLFAIVGGLGTALCWIDIVVQYPSTRYAGIAWLAVGFTVYAVYRRRIVGEPLTETVRAPVQLGAAIALEYRNILVPIVEGRESEEAVELACRLAAERRATIVAVRVIVVPLDLPLDTELRDEERRANELLDEAKARSELYGVRVISRIVRARQAGRAIVDEAARRQSEIVVLGTPRTTRPRRAVFGKTVDYVLRNAPTRVMVAAGRKVAV
jgi:APA family basic amino acid/polyamine antiporter